MNKRRLPLATGIATEPYWSIYAHCWRAATTLATNQPTLRGTAAGILDALDKCAVIHVDESQIRALPTLFDEQDETAWRLKIDPFPFSCVLITVGTVYEGNELSRDQPPYAALLLEGTAATRLSRELHTTSKIGLPFFRDQRSGAMDIAGVVDLSADRKDVIVVLADAEKRLVGDGREIASIIGDGVLNALKSLTLLECANVES